MTTTAKGLFDGRVETYDRWFETPIGRLVKAIEEELILEFLQPAGGDLILDAGCGSGIFTAGILERGAKVTGLDISLPMLTGAGAKATGRPFYRVQGDIIKLPYRAQTFDKTISVTAFEFIGDAADAARELFRVTKSGGCVVVATLNSLGPWAARRKRKAGNRRHPLFEHAVFRSPDEIRTLIPGPCRVKTAVHFQKDDDPARAREIEMQGRAAGLETGAFVIAGWEKKGGGGE